MKLYLNSSDSSNNKYTLDEAIEGKWKLISFVFTNNIYNVTDNNNKIYVNENGIDYVVTLTNGYYTSSDLESELSSQLNSTLTGTVVVAFDDKTNKYTITNTITFYFKFGTNSNNSARKLIGCNGVDGTTATTQTSDNSIDLNPYKEIFINIEQNDDRNIFGVNYFNSSLYICGCGSNGELIRYKYNEHPTQYVKFKRTKKLEIRLHDSNNNDIELNSEYSMIIEKC